MLSGLVLLLACNPTHSDSCDAFLPAYDEQAALHASIDGASDPDSLAVDANPEETNLSNLRQMTFGGQNAEAYWSANGKKITYQARQPGYPDEQIFTMNADGSNKTLMSTGKGRCTCSYYTPNGKWLYFSSTHEKNEGPQKPLDMSKGYFWMVNPDFAMYRRSTDPKNSKLELVLRMNGYVAETTIAPNGKYLTFTANVDGDLNIYRADLDGKNIKQLTTEEGYDGGPFISWDSKKIVYRRDLIENEAERSDYRALLKENLVRPSKLEIWIMDADGSNKKQVTNLSCASFAPFIHPDGKRIIFSSNYGDPKGREFDLWMINVDGTGLTRITKTPDFDGFPMFTKDGKKLLWASNRFGKVRGETNVFTADWKN
jgi:TolB protein